jgi:endonuclease/exonuclease/phosphatase family metal-dependent hydrolase
MAAGRVSVLTYNVNFGLARERRGEFYLSEDTENVMKAILTSGADMVVLQETNRAWEYAVQQAAAAAQYPHQRWLHESAAGGSAILCRHHIPIVSCELVDPRDEVEGSWFKQLVATVEVDGRKIIVVGVHLRPPKGMMFWTTSIRRREIAYVMQWIADRSDREGAGIETMPMLVMGDFNEDDGYSALSFLRERYGLVDALERFVEKGQETMEVDVPLLFGAFYWHRKFRLDHICFREEYFICEECRVVPGYRRHASDHQPVYASFIIRTANESANKGCGNAVEGQRRDENLEKI